MNLEANLQTSEPVIHQLLRERWSPRAFSETPIPDAELASLLEAARWAPSSMNAQPWGFIVADRQSDPESHARVVSTLMAPNAAWAGKAPVLIVVAARLAHGNGSPNRHAFYDTGAAVALLSVEATGRGLRLHQMGGFNSKLAAELLGIPESHEPIVVLAIGYPGDPATLSPELRARESAPRQRRPVTEFTFQGRWGTPLAGF